MTDAIVYSQKNHIGVVTLNRLPALNALNAPMILSLKRQLNRWQDDHQIHAVVICSAGGRAFCAGGDVRSIYVQKGESHREQMDFFRQEYQLNRLIHDFGKPYIALMDGITMGGGVGISLHGSHPVASERFCFAMPETGIGFFPEIGASHLLTRCPGHWGVYLGLTGARLGPSTSAALGLVKAVIQSDQFPSFLDVLVDTDLSTDADAQVSRVLEPFTQPTLSFEVDALQPMVDACFQYDNMESILSALADGTDEWHRDTHRVLSQKSPLSLKVTLKQLKKAMSMGMPECLEMDYCLTSHFLREADFYEGVRALLVDKDNRPHWDPATLGKVTEAMVSRYFTPRVDS